MLEQNCSECGVEKLDFLPEELDASDSCDDVTWEKYEYVTIMMKGGKSKKKNTVGKESYKARAYVPVFQRSITYVSCTSISSNLAKQSTQKSFRQFTDRSRCLYP